MGRNQDPQGALVDVHGGAASAGQSGSSVKGKAHNYHVAQQVHGLPWWHSGAEPTCQRRTRGDMGLIPQSGRSLEEEMATHSSILAWEIPWTEEPGGLQCMGSQGVGHAFVEYGNCLEKFRHEYTH